MYQRNTEKERKLSHLIADSSNPFLSTIVVYQECDSTMERARELISQKEIATSGAILTYHQTQGRGTRGRTWVSPDHNLMMSYVYPLQDGSTETYQSSHGLTLSLGVGLSLLLRTQNFPVYLKWPNDLVSNHGEKCGGILCEMYTSSATAKQFVIIGVGINCFETPLIESSYSISSLHSLLLEQKEYELSYKEHFVDALFILCTKTIHEYATKFFQHGFSAVRSLWKELSYFSSPDSTKRYNGNILLYDASVVIKSGKYKGEKRFFEKSMVTVQDVNNEGCLECIIEDSKEEIIVYSGSPRKIKIDRLK